MPVTIRSQHRPLQRPPREFVGWEAIIGMNGLGDNLHQRAIVRQKMARVPILLSTPWPCVYHDLVGEHLKLALRPTTLRTQAKNTTREVDRYDLTSLPFTYVQHRIWYQGEEVRARGSVLAAMVANAGCDMATADFRLPVPEAWQALLDKRLGRWRPLLPILVYRPLVERTEWGGCAGRNPDFDAYNQIFQSIRKHYFVVSVADLVPGVEWIASPPIAADVEFHRGELVFEELAALFQRASLVFCSPGFAVILAQAVGTPVICTFGGYENSSSFSAGAKFAPYLGIDPIEPCSCFNHKHVHRKTIDIPRAIERAQEFTRRQYAHGPAPTPSSTRAAVDPGFPTGAAAVADD